MANTAATYPLTAANNASVGTVDWSVIDFSRLEDGNGASFSSTIGGGTNQISHYISVSNFGFAIPTGSRIDGILAEVNKRNQNSAYYVTHDSAVRIVKGGAIGATDRSSGTAWNAAPYAYTSYGSSSDQWGTSWTSTDINASNFGFAIAATVDLAAASNCAEVDAIRITIYYTVPPEVGPVESITVSESVRISLSLPSPVLESVTVSDVSTILIPTYFPSVFDSVTVSENTALVRLNYGEFSSSESLYISESITLLIPVLYISAIESVTLTEVVSISESSLLVLLSVSDSVTVTDSLQPNVTVTQLIMQENVAISENLSFDMSSVPGYNMPGSTPQGSVSRWGGLTVGGGL